MPLRYQSGLGQPCFRCAPALVHVGKETAVNDEKVQTTFRLSPHLLNRFRHALVDAGKPMSPIIEQLVQGWVTLRENEEHRPEAVPLHRQFLRSAPVVALIRDLDDRLVYANKEFERFCGRTRQELLNSRPDEQWPGQVGRTIMAHDAVVRIHKKPILSVDTIGYADHQSAKAGDSRRMTIRFPMTDSNGECAYVGALGFDLKAIAKATPIANRSKSGPISIALTPSNSSLVAPLPIPSALLVSFFYSVPAIATWKDLQGRMIWANQEYERVIGRKRDEVVGHLPTDNWSGDVGTAILGHDALVRESGIPHLTVDELPVGDKTLQRLNIRFPVFSADSRLLNTASLGIDLRIARAGSTLLNNASSGEQKWRFLSDVCI